mgnify:FL=1
MDVSVIIPARNEGGYIGYGLMMLEKQTFPGSWEVIVVDNASDDHTGDIVREAFPWVRVIEEPVPGVQRARERGRLAATGNILAFLDADTIPSTQWIENGLRHFRESDIVALTGPYLFFDGRFRDDTYAYLQRWLFFPFSKYVAEQSNMSLAFFANMFIRADILAHELHGFDTSYTFDGDDVETATRLSWVGKVLYAQDMCVKTSARNFKKNGLVCTVHGHFRAAREVSQRFKRAHVRIST